MFRCILRTVVAVAFLAALPANLTMSRAEAAEKAVVQYRLAKQKTIHLDSEKEAKSVHQSLKNLGCATKLGGHAGHFDLTYHCPKWRSAAFDGHDAAHKWQNWLKKLGFETGHKH
jgi:hypothetical protein